MGEKFTEKFVPSFLKIVLGLTLLYFTIWKVDWNLFLQSLLSINFAWLAFAVFSVLCSLGLKVWRWSILLKYHQITISPGKIIIAYLLGLSANILFFFRGGEIVRVLELHQSGKDDIAAITTTMVIEKYLDLIMLSIIVFLVSAFLPQEILLQWKRFSPYLIGVSFLLIILVIISPRLWKLLDFQKVQNKFLRRIVNNFEVLLLSSIWMRDKVKVLKLVGISILIWVIMLSTNMILFHSISLRLGWQAAAMVLILVFLGLLPALMPGNIGPFTYFARLALLPFMVESSIAFTFAVLLYSIVTFPPLITTGILLIFPGIKRPKVEL